MHVDKAYKEFLADGHNNPLVTTQAELKKQGAPLELGVTKREHRDALPMTQRRPDLSWINHGMHTWRARHPSASKQEMAQARNSFQTAWKRLSKHEQDGDARSTVAREDAATSDDAGPSTTSVGTGSWKLHDGSSYNVTHRSSQPLLVKRESPVQ